MLINQPKRYVYPYIGCRILHNYVLSTNFYSHIPIDRIILCAGNNKIGPDSHKWNPVLLVMDKQVFCYPVFPHIGNIGIETTDYFFLGF